MDRSLVNRMRFMIAQLLSVTGSSHASNCPLSFRVDKSLPGRLRSGAQELIEPDRSRNPRAVHRRGLSYDDTDYPTATFFSR